MRFSIANIYIVLSKRQATGLMMATEETVRLMVRISFSCLKKVTSLVISHTCDCLNDPRDFNGRIYKYKYKHLNEKQYLSHPTICPMKYPVCDS